MDAPSLLGRQITFLDTQVCFCGVKRIPEAQALALLEEVLDLDSADRDALPGSVVKSVKDAVTDLRKRRNRLDRLKVVRPYGSRF